MLNKTLRLLLAFLLLTSITFVCFADDHHQAIQIHAIDSLLTNQHADRIDKAAHIYTYVPKDTIHRDVRDFPQNFKQKYLSDKDFDYDHSAENTGFLKRVLKAIVKLIENLFSFDDLAETGKVSVFILKTIVGLILLVFLYFVIRFLSVKNFNGIFKKKVTEAAPIDFNNVEQLIKEADFAALIAMSEQNGDTRQSIRLYYLWLLKVLNERNIIQWTPEKTNADYMRQIQMPEIRQEFTYLSYLYNYIWYGEFHINDTEYQSAKQAFQKFIGGKQV